METCQLCQQGKIQIKAMMRKYFLPIVLVRSNPIVKKSVLVNPTTGHIP